MSLKCFEHSKICLLLNFDIIEMYQTDGKVINMSHITKTQKRYLKSIVNAILYGHLKVIKKRRKSMFTQNHVQWFDTSSVKKSNSLSLSLSTNRIKEREKKRHPPPHDACHSRK